MARIDTLMLCGVLAACAPSESGTLQAGGTEAEGTGAPGSTSSIATATTGATGAGMSGSSGSEGTQTTGLSGTGCGIDPGFRGAIVGQVEIEGADRRFLLVLPDGYDPARAYPFVFMLHGRGSRGDEFRQYAGLEEAAQGGAIFVYPDALPNRLQGGLTGWNMSALGPDVAFVDRLLEDFSTNLCIDPDRIFATGHSLGGFFSNALGCVRGETFRAIAPVAGGGAGMGCEGAVAAWLAHNPDDNVVPIVLGEASRAKWIEANGCDETTTVAVDPPPCVEYQGCDDGYEVVWCEHMEETLGIGPHGWPGFAGAGIWSFFDGR